MSSDMRSVFDLTIYIIIFNA